MNNHFLILFIFSILTSLVLASIAKNSTRERLKYFFIFLGSFVFLSLLASLLMYPFPF